MDPHADRAVVVLGGDGQQLDEVSESAGEIDVGRGDVRDALVVDVTGDHGSAEGDRGQDRCLGARIVTLNVSCRVTFGVAEALGLGQGIVRS